MTTEQKLIKAKMNLLELGAYLGNVSEACRTRGYSRDTFYRLKKKYDEGSNTCRGRHHGQLNGEQDADVRNVVKKVTRDQA